MTSAAHFKMPFIIFALKIAAIIFFGCTSNEEVSINYLDQEPPGMEAKTFAPGIVSSGLSEHSSPAFSKDGKLVLWTVMDSDYHGYLLEMKYENGKWSQPARPSFADSIADDYYASFSTDGTKVFFSSRRKMPAGYPETTDMRIWEVQYNSDGWGTPIPIDTTASIGYEYAHSSSLDGTVYFSSTLPGNTGMNVRRSEIQNGKYMPAELLPFNLNSIGYEDGPYISPDGSFLIFESQRPGSIKGGLDLYISFRNKNGQWTIPVNMGPQINSEFSERFARVSPDGKYLFFGSTRNKTWGFDIFWISSKLIDDLKAKMDPARSIPELTGKELIAALDTKDIGRSATLLKGWLRSNPNSLDATVIYISMLRKQQQYPEAEKTLSGNPSAWKENESVLSGTALVKIGLNKDAEADSLLKPLLIAGDQQRERYLYLSAALLEMGKLKRSEELFNKVMTDFPSGFHWYQRSKELIRIGEKDKAIDALYKAAETGNNISKEEIVNNPAFESLKTDPRWKTLTEKLK